MGYRVALVIPHSQDEEIDGVSIVALPRSRSRLARALAGSFLALAKALSTKSEVYHFHDPELIPIGLILKILGKCVVFDIHELIAPSLADKKWLRNQTVLTLSRFCYNTAESVAVRIFDGLVLAEEGYRAYYSKRYPKHIGKFAIIRNYPLLATIDQTAPANYSKMRPVVLYAGSLTEVRGIAEAVDAAGLLDGRVELVLFGKWGDESFFAECRKRAGWKHTRYLGTVTPREVYAHMKIADVGISVLHPITNYTTSLPVKVFEYMSSQVPVIMSGFRYWKDTFHECAFFIEPRSAEALAGAISTVLDNPAETQRLVSNGRTLVESHYSWESEADTLERLYSSITDRRSQLSSATV